MVGDEGRWQLDVDEYCEMVLDRSIDAILVVRGRRVSSKIGGRGSDVGIDVSSNRSRAARSCSNFSWMMA